MKLITERTDVHDRIIDYLQSIGWEYLPPDDIQNLRAYDIKQPFLIPVVKEKLKELNRGIITDENTLEQEFFKVVDEEKRVTNIIDYFFDEERRNEFTKG